jgi:hypothetical protein
MGPRALEAVSTPRFARKDVRDFARALVAAGLTIEHRPPGRHAGQPGAKGAARHPRILWNGRVVAGLPSTPRHGRWQQTVLERLRHAGFDTDTIDWRQS